MEIQVRLSAGLQHATGTTRLSVTLPSGATVRDLLHHLRETYPSLDAGLAAALPVVRGDVVPPAHLLVPGDEVAFLSPVSGGSAQLRARIGSIREGSPWP